MPGRSLSLVLVSSEWEGGSESPFRDWKAEFCKLQQVQKVPAFLCRLDLGGRGGASAGWLSTRLVLWGSQAIQGWAQPRSTSQLSSVKLKHFTVCRLMFTFAEAKCFLTVIPFLSYPENTFLWTLGTSGFPTFRRGSFQTLVLAL